ncbi:MAG: DUF72 domain-containing protein [Armatimonadota bacterium]|nr:DUF72 domain-containing protein [Armatimonadota bacterium]MDR7612596.1 DUF72 domain-containing protein [Armatimonadota bacterium]
MGRMWIGTSGWVYPHWRGRFYPAEGPASRWLEFYARHFDTVEVNNTFYRLPAAGTFDEWARRAPEGFLFALKASRFITHVKRLRAASAPVRTFLGRARRLGDRLGPVLFQLPPRFRVDRVRLEAFLRILPAGWRFAMEFRDPSWHTREVFDLLAERNVAYCIMVGLEPTREVATADFVYIRFHSPPTGVEFGLARLRRWAEALRRLSGERRDVYAYFNNDAEGAAVRDALALRDLLGA